MKLYFGAILSVIGWSAVVTCYPNTASANNTGHNLITGLRMYGDKMLYSGDEIIDSSFMRVKTKEFHWPLHGTSQEIITRLEVVDKAKDGSGGYAFLTGGGPGSREAKLHLKTQRGNSADFHITIYGK